MFGLPIPEELRLSETEPGAGGPRETLSKEEEERSKVALWGVEGDVLEWVMKGGEGLSVWLSEVCVFLFLFLSMLTAMEAHQVFLWGLHQLDGNGMGQVLEAISILSC